MFQYQVMSGQIYLNWLYIINQLKETKTKRNKMDMASDLLTKRRRNLFRFVFRFVIATLSFARWASSENSRGEGRKSAMEACTCAPGLVCTCRTAGPNDNRTNLRESLPR